MSRQRKSSARQLGHPRLLHPWEAGAAATDVALQAAPPALGPACSTPLNRQQSRAEQQGGVREQRSSSTNSRERPPTDSKKGTRTGKGESCIVR